MASLLITVLDTSDWGCEHTAEDTAAYEQACADAIAEAYPTAEIGVECQHRFSRKILVISRNDEGKIDASVDASAADEAIVDACDEICRSVWDQGFFWASPPPVDA